jgi:hypothetical protein
LLLYSKPSSSDITDKKLVYLPVYSNISYWHNKNSQKNSSKKSYPQYSTLSMQSNFMSLSPAHLLDVDAFSHVVECIFLLQQDNVIHQVLLDLWGESGNLCTIYALLTVPLDTLTVLPMVEPLMPDPSPMHTRIGLHSSKTCMTIATAKLPGLIITSLISPHPTLTAIAF